jgi:Ca2+-binding RTX toxin-like protein
MLLIGDSGNNVLIGGPNDTLTGGGGADTFVFNPIFGKETITDFNTKQNFIAFDKHLFADASQVLAHTTQSGKNTVITYDAGDKVTLVGVQIADLHDSNFHFF